MSPHTGPDLVGILVGSILREAHPIAFYLYQDGHGGRHVAVYASGQGPNSYQTVSSLAQTFAPAIKAVWTNKYYPCWWYLQFNALLTPERLKLFGLPWAVYHDWSKKLAPE